MMEPLRPFVDALVCDMLAKEKLNCFETEQKHQLLDVLNGTVMNSEKKVSLNYAIKIYCKSIFDALNNNDLGMIKWSRFV